ncbi:SDR family oxidoreductase [Acuticoccus sp. M5D2P5]|uniref:SDR family NAD(P)-dependent oxidoreductase n=1 Tax=Acuticoccus kalidii TaxID=2910977 RepID=UPI001F1DCD3A|nr:SDR family oxidoreductase [Acuticoccus kalidii]MCF3935705.1 SDR family oxidoreductase [Acuticoccus kalidii]
MSTPSLTPDPSSVDRPVAIVTGAGQSLGKAIAERLHGDGFSVAVTDREADLAATVANGLDADGRTARSYHLDVSSAEAIVAVFAKVAAEMGVPAALVNNAGIYPNHALIDMPVEAWDGVMTVNLRGTFLCTQAFARARAAIGGGGAIVNLASAAAFSARVGVAHYSASKAGIVMFTKSAAQEFGPLGIRVNAIAPGLIEVRDDQVTPEYRDNYLSMIPRGRTGVAADIASAAAYLVSPEADFVNGHCLVVDGGFLTGRTLVRSGDDG